MDQEGEEVERKKGRESNPRQQRGCLCSPVPSRSPSGTGAAVEKVSGEGATKGKDKSPKEARSSTSPYYPAGPRGSQRIPGQPMLGSRTVSETTSNHSWGKTQDSGTCL